MDIDLIYLTISDSPITEFEKFGALSASWKLYIKVNFHNFKKKKL